MNRFAVIALSAAAVLGTTGGVVVATMHTNDTPARTPASDGPSTPPPPSPTSSATPDQTNEPLLYASNRQIHDGTKVIDFSGPTNVERVTRLADGYLIDESTDSQVALYQLWTVSPQGDARKIARIGDLGDVNPEGTEVVGVDYATAATQVWTLPDGKVVAKWNQDTDAGSYAGFAGNQVLISQLFGQPANQLKRWNPATGKTTVLGEGFEQMVLSPGGSYLTGAVTKSGTSSDGNHCLHLQSTFLKHNSVAWDTCDWSYDVRAPEFSPDGTRLLVVPPGNADNPPSHFGVIDASDGPSKLVGEFDPPAGTIGAEWADNGHLYVYGSNSTTPQASRSGTWIDRCDLQGSCQRVVSSKELVTVGSSR